MATATATITQPTAEGGPPAPAPVPAPSDVSATTTGSTGAAGGVRITADPSSNSLVILADTPTYRKIEAALQQIDRPRAQVAIHAIVAEVTLTDELRNGIEFYLKSNDLGLGNNGSVGISAGSVLQKVFPGFNFLLGSESDPRMILSALDSITTVKVISSPSIVVMNNQNAVLQVGAQVPVATRQASDVSDPNAPIVNNIEFRDTGIILKVTPKISDNGIVNMEIAQEISAVSKESASGTLTPVI